jgi:hypothetical protein
MGLLQRPRASAVVDFYATVERINFAARAISTQPDEKVLLENYTTLVDVVEQAGRKSMPLLLEFPFDEHDADFRAEIAKWGATEASSAMIKTGNALDAIVASLRSALTPRWLNTIGLSLGILGVLIIFEWGPPQPSFDEGVAIGLSSDNVLENGKTVTENDADVRRLKHRYEIMSRAGLGLIGLGFVAQLAAVRRAG